MTLAYRWTAVVLCLGLAACHEGTSAPQPPFTSLSAGFDHACGIAPAVGVVCWGGNGSGQLGHHTTELCFVYPCSTVPVVVTGGHDFVAIAAGGAHTCALDRAGAAWCWGTNRTGQLGTGSLADTSSETPRAVAGGHRFSAISVGTAHTCALTLDGSAWCWGENYSGAIGRGDTARAVATPSVVAGHQFSALSAGSNFTCGIAATALYCWGDNSEGQLGSGDTVHRYLPALVTPAFGARTLATASHSVHICAADANGVLYCWGQNVAWQLGDGTDTARLHPTPVSTSERFEVTAAGQEFTCAVNSSGITYCWGAKDFGDRGLFGAGANDQSPVPVPGPVGLSFRTLAGGHQFACGLTTDGRAYCWGTAFRGKLGNGAQTGTFAPTEVQVPRGN